jgi:two-component system LytT family sensor kinase
MFKAYQFKWYFIVAGILTISSLLLRQESFKEVRWWEFLDYALHLFSMLLICWLIHGYFLLRKFSISNYANHFVSNILATISVFTISLISYNLLPHTSLAESVSYNTIPNFVTHISGAFLLSIICYCQVFVTHYKRLQTPLQNQQTLPYLRLACCDSNLQTVSPCADLPAFEQGP